MREIVGTITAYEHRGRVRLVIVANTGETLGIDLDAVEAEICVSVGVESLQAPS